MRAVLRRYPSFAISFFRYFFAMYIHITQKEVLTSFSLEQGVPHCEIKKILLVQSGAWFMSYGATCGLNLAKVQVKLLSSRGIPTVDTMFVCQEAPLQSYIKSCIVWNWKIYWPKIVTIHREVFFSIRCINIPAIRIWHCASYISLVV